MESINRRHFLTALAAAAASGCGQAIPEGRYTEADVDLLAAQRDAEAQRDGLSPFGRHQYSGYRGLSKLPWFELNADDQLVCVDTSFKPAIDVHCHLGMSVLFQPKLDYLAASDSVQHLLNCDQPPACELDLDVYANGGFTEQSMKRLRKEIRDQGLWGSEYAATQTIPNLLNEMDNMRVEQAFLLPIKLGLWFGDNLTERWRAVVEDAGQAARLPVGFSVNPHDPDRLSQLEAFAKRGFKLLKLHPTVQRFFPDDPSMMPLYELAQDLNVKIFFHGGRAGIEPEAAQPYAMPRHYRAVFADFPRLQFIVGHAGARDFAAMLDLASSFNNVWIGTHGQGLTDLDTMISKTAGTRLLFGTDWPFYHIGMSLAKILIATDSPARKSVRDQILHDNAQQFLAS